LTLNGKKVGDDFLSPGWTKYDKTCLYDTRDITADLKRAKTPPASNSATECIICRRRGSSRPATSVTLSARSRSSRKSAWNMPTARSKPLARMKTGARARPDYFLFDLQRRRFRRPARATRLEQINFDDSKWPPAIVVNGPGGELRGLSCAAPPIRSV
jgi:alpha-L-rhamnosidase